MRDFQFPLLLCWFGVLHNGVSCVNSLPHLSVRSGAMEGALAAGCCPVGWLFHSLSWISKALGFCFQICKVGTMVIPTYVLGWCGELRERIMSRAQYSAQHWINVARNYHWDHYPEERVETPSHLGAVLYSFCKLYFSSVFHYVYVFFSLRSLSY